MNCSNCCCCTSDDDDKLLDCNESSPVTTQPRYQRDRAQTRHGERYELDANRDENVGLKQQLQTLRTKTDAQRMSDKREIEYRDVDILKLKAELHELGERNNELLTRLSANASAMLTYDNPNIADLSDLNRPTKLAEQFSELYDNEWTGAFGALISAYQGNKTEKEICEILLSVLGVIYCTCHEKAKADLQTLTTALLAFSGDDAPAKETLKALTDDRKKHYSVGIKAVGEELKESLRPIVAEQDISLIANFLGKCTEVCWLMAIQNPPVCIDNETTRGQSFDTNLYKYYTKSGPTIGYIVWPAMYLSEGGHILSKGVAQGQKQQQGVDDVSASKGDAHGQKQQHDVDDASDAKGDAHGQKQQQDVDDVSASKGVVQGQKQEQDVDDASAAKGDTQGQKQQQDYDDVSAAIDQDKIIVRL